MPSLRKDVVLIGLDLAERLKPIAAEEGCSVSGLVEDIVTLWLDEREGPMGDVQAAFALASLPQGQGAVP